MAPIKMLILCCLGLALLAGADAPAQTKSDAPAEPESAGALFESVLADQGLEAAVARFRQTLDDTTGAYGYGGQELVRELPNRLTMAGRSDAALALIKLVEGLYGEHPVYWKELGVAYLKTMDPTGARMALTKSLRIDPDQAEVSWMLENLEALKETYCHQSDALGLFEPGESTGLTGPYLGQDPPGSTPEVFAPGILCSLGHEYSIAFAPDGREIVFSRSGVGAMICRWEEDGWTAPEKLRLMGEDYRTEEASIAPDGGSIFFCVRPLGQGGRRDIYMADRTDAGWGEARYLFPGMYPTATLDRTLYYTETGGSPDYGVLARRPWRDGVFGEAEVLVGGGVNSEAPDAHPCITPDESLLVFDSMREDDPGLFVSLRNEDGTWGEAVSLTRKLGIPPVGQGALSPDGGYLFFCMAGDMYWVKADGLWERP